MTDPCKKCGGTFYIQMNILWDTGLEKGTPICAECFGLISRSPSSLLRGKIDGHTVIGYWKPTSEKFTEDAIKKAEDIFKDGLVVHSGTLIPRKGVEILYQGFKERLKKELGLKRFKTSQ